MESEQSISNEIEREGAFSKKNIFVKILGVLGFLAIMMCSFLIFYYRDVFKTWGSLGYFSVFLLCFICNASVLFPAPSLAVALAAATALNPIIVVVVGSLGATCGEGIGYLTGILGKSIINFDTEKRALLLKKYGVPMIFLFAIIPLPFFDVIGLAAGYFKIAFYKFFIACYCGKFLKMLGLVMLGTEYLKQYI